jgi:glutaredoxin-like protein NrdH
MKIVHVKGKNAGKIVLYTLSTCGWCRKTKEFLRRLGLAYDYVETDLLVGKEKDSIVREVKKWNPVCSFPTIVINDQYCIVGFNEERIKEVLKL